MKRTLIFLFFLAYNISISSAQDKPAYNFTVKLPGLEEGRKVHLAHYFGYSQYFKVDSALVENGILTFKGTEPLKGGIYLIVLNQAKYYDFIVSGDEKDITIEADTLDFVKSVKFTGSKENDILFGYRKFLMEKSSEAMALQKLMQQQKDPASMEVNRGKMKKLQEDVNLYMKNVVADNKKSFAAKIINANIEPELPTEAPKLANGRTDSTYLFNLYKKKYFDNIDFSDDRMLRTPFIQSKVEKYFKDLVYQVTDSINVDADKVLKLAKKNKDVYRYVLWWITNKYENIEIVGLDGVFVHLAKDYYLKDVDWMDSTQTAKFRERVQILEPIQTGKIMPPLVLQDTLGRDINLYDIKAKYTIVYFYSYDCGHCRDHAPELVKYYEENKNKGIAIYHAGIHVTGDPAEELKKTKEFINNYKTKNLINVLDSKFRYDFRKKYDIYSTPTSYILDSEKRIIGRRIPVEEFNKFIEFHEKKVQAEKAAKASK
ncbi:MAG: AhpC/TSA family protein [Cytophagaceae bacterium]|nr:AhpC/TSA family protein [Cytophagaceae bacterium]MBL0300352.1 AhpC/TSA family protein [Cytophagaceae bacterium]MBL0327284.1 AhpC/TSA family protein [Cytophagaceae bacterium]